MLRFLVAFHLFFHIPSLAKAVDAQELNLLNKAIEGLKSNIERSKDNLAPSIAEALKEVEKHQASISNAINPIVENQTQITVPDNVNSETIDGWLKSYEKIKADAKCSKAKDGFYIFVSFSLPKTLLETLDKTARKIGARLVIRGLKDNSFKETLKYIKEIKQEGIIIDVDPEIFKRFQVNLTPAFVISENQKFDKIVGNVSIAYALSRFASDGENKELSNKYLKRLGNDE